MPGPKLTFNIQSGDRSAVHESRWRTPDLIEESSGAIVLKLGWETEYSRSLKSEAYLTLCGLLSAPTSPEKTTRLINTLGAFPGRHLASMCRTSANRTSSVSPTLKYVLSRAATVAMGISQDVSHGGTYAQRQCEKRSTMS
jgi:hypothetical protein